jgi:fermentation-respiration switch protein FrsA (DUF1100 family)
MGRVARMRWLLLLVVAGLLLKLLITVIEPRLVFFPSAGEDRTPGELGIRYTAVRIATTDGERLAAWLLEPDAPIADVVYFHGNGGNLSVWLPILAGLQQQGLRVLAIDYRGYGLSSGRPSERGLYRDAEAAVRHLAMLRRESSVDRPLVFWGRSLGGPVAAAAARVVTPDGLILESTFADKAAVVRANPLLRILNALSGYRFSTVEMLEHFSNPVLVIHGTRDSVIPYPLGRALYERLRAPKSFLDIPGADHNDAIGPQQRVYWTQIRQFVDAVSHR